jgi:hypothetical protein
MEHHHNWKHGMRNTRQYNTWNHMMNRCYNKNDSRFESYGGRGIKVCKKWHNFIGFWEDMKDSYYNDSTLERKDNNGNYCQKNCKWASWSEQRLNRRNTLKVKYNNKFVVLKQLCDDLNLPYKRIFQRIYTYNWSIEDSLKIKPWGKKNNSITKQ